jgi:hypothetical protein
VPRAYTPDIQRATDVKGVANKGQHIMNIAKVFSIALIAGAAALSPALAQAPAGAVMLVPGVYTTPEISAKCQAYAAKRAGLSGYTDSARQSVALACAQKLWKQEIAKNKS